MDNDGGIKLGAIHRKIGDTQRLFFDSDFLDRFDSLILVAPMVFHYVHFLVGFGMSEQTRILTG